MSFSRADKVAVQSMQTGEEELKKIQAAKKDRGKRSRGEHFTLEEYKKTHDSSILNSYDIEVADKNYLENYRILKESGMSDADIEKLIGDCRTDSKKKKRKINPHVEEKAVEIVVSDDGCKVWVSHDSLPFYAEMVTRHGKPKQNKTFTGGYYWTLPCECFTLGGSRYSISKTPGAWYYHNDVSVTYNSIKDIVTVQTSDKRWIGKVIGRLDEKYGATPLWIRAVKDGWTAEEKDGVPHVGQDPYEVCAEFPSSILEVPSKIKKK